MLTVLMLAGNRAPATPDTVSVTEEYYSEDSMAAPLVLHRAVMSAEDWTQLTEDPAFAYRDKREAETEQKERREGGLEKALNSFFGFFASGTGTLIFWLLVFGVLGYMLYRIFKGEVSRLFGRKEKPVREEEAPGQLSREDLLSSDWQSSMEAAVAAQDFGAATRFAFVHALQLLHQQGHITYRIDATNYEYYRAIKSEALKPLLKNLLLRYEYAWFGRMPVDRVQWEQTFVVYSQLKRTL
ncbi:MAG: hypothetical protein JNL13_01880 [Chitinophagaceae bacterium]|nr:hypothetical protein [Chitinophagaceae bacterium]